MKELQPEHVEHCRPRHVAQFRSPGDPRLGIGDLSRWPHAARTRRDRDVLLAVDRIGHGRRVEARADIDPPQHIERLVIEDDRIKPRLPPSSRIAAGTEDDRQVKDKVLALNEKRRSGPPLG